MKKAVNKCLLTMMLGAAMFSCSQKQEGYVIQGEIKGVSDGMVYLKQYTDKGFTDVDSAVVSAGKFSFEGVTAEPMAYAVSTVKENRRPLVFFIGNESVNLVMDEADKTIQVTGSAYNDLYSQNAAVVRTPGYSVDSLVAAHPASPVSAYILLKDFSSQMGYEELKALRDKFDASLGNSAYVKQIDVVIERLSKLQIGAVAPDFTLPDTEGNPVSLSSFRGKYVLIDFWASWCPDCRKENPSIVAAYNKFKDKNFAILGVSLDRKKEPWLQAIEKDGLTWTHVSDLKDWKSEVAVQYVIRWIPNNYLLDPDGKIIASSLEGEALMEKLQEVLK